MPYTTCRRCHRLTPLGHSYCPTHTRQPPPRHDRPAGWTRYPAEYQRNRAALLADSDICWICGAHGADTADHVIPLDLGGTHNRDNLRPAHKRCNSSRGNGLRNARANK